VIPFDQKIFSFSLYDMLAEGVKREERNRTFGMDRGVAMAPEWAARGIFGLKRPRLGRNFDTSVHNCLWRTVAGVGN